MDLKKCVRLLLIIYPAKLLYSYYSARLCVFLSTMCLLIDEYIQ